MLRFSLMLPTLDEAWRVRALLDSIARQRYPRDCIELLVADGGSTDATVEINSTGPCARSHMRAQES